MTNNNVNYFIIVCLVVALVLSSPQLALSKYEELSLQHNITGHSCAISLSNPSVYSIAFSYGFLGLFILYTVMLTAIYLAIGTKLYFHHKGKIRNKNKPDSSKNKAISNKMTKIAFTVSVVFGMSYIPVFVVQTTDKQIEEEYLSALEFSVLRIVERLYVINHVANPFIYGVFDNHFRQNIWRLLRWKFNEKKRKKFCTSTSKPMASPSIL
ncbi:FSHR [Mytilus coruscus]|uniref:FSHR n=1 Tax=Mytilus coruscus TaxID=42192 RepID=A0A6J8AQ87_MYTCO|nr:FSHR [Mytilus coruscus]